MFGLDFWTFFWFAIPMPLLVVWAIVTFFTDKERDDS